MGKRLKIAHCLKCELGIIIITLVLISIIVGNYALQQQSFAISDTGTSFMAGPANVVREMMSALNACFDEENALVSIKSMLL